MIRFFQSILYVLWRIWFYVLVALPIVVMFPFLLVLSSREKWYPQFFWLARNVWANVILYGMGFYPMISRLETLERGKSYMLVSNHTSMTDIMLMLKASKNPFVFVGKKELVKIPIFGFFYKRVCIMVDRSSARSRSGVYKRAKARLDNGLSICIYPEGGVPNEDMLMDEFKDGAFRLAIEYQIPIVPMAFVDNKARFPFAFFKGSLGKMRAVVLPFISTEGLSVASREDTTRLKNKTREVIFEKLSEFQHQK
ncbi:lysophospholipid acyltransferase family protein [Sungkyunkwania multivorans]|uniref:Lysophospholipid acyltransferase family protein n=1 Tax=Sungkyunkwania multivorans TaxID=1173618 RepID=A0ABW3D1Y8_9FLAO